MDRTILPYVFRTTHPFPTPPRLFNYSITKYTDANAAIRLDELSHTISQLDPKKISDGEVKVKVDSAFSLINYLIIIPRARMGSESITNQNAALIIDHQSDFTTPPKKKETKNSARQDTQRLHLAQNCNLQKRRQTRN